MAILCLFVLCAIVARGWGCGWGNIAQAYVSAWRQWMLAHEHGTTLGLDDYFSASALAQVQYAITSTSEAGWQVRHRNSPQTQLLKMMHTLEGVRVIEERRWQVRFLVRQ